MNGKETVINIMYERIDQKDLYAVTPDSTKTYPQID